MDQFNFWLLPLVAFIPLIVGSIWYNPKVFGNAWMKSAEISEERTRTGNMLKIFGLTYLFSLLGAYIITPATVHQLSVTQLFFMDPAMSDVGSAISRDMSSFLDTYGERHRTFGHGVIHGVEFALFAGLVMLGVPALFERRPFKYTMIHVGFWMLCFGLMGGILCAYL